jgi:8-oxo-dGTP pyrophosphatase MutT (NUDIX family)
MPHIHEKVDFTAEVFVVYDNKVLLRKHDKYGIWLSVGGHIELDEDPNQAAIREVKEEVGLDIELLDTRTYRAEDQDYKELIPPAFMNRHRINESHEHVTLTYFGQSKNDKVTNDSDEVAQGLRWFSVDDLTKIDKNTPPRITVYAKAALQAVLDIKSQA